MSSRKDEEEADWMKKKQAREDVSNRHEWRSKPALEIRIRAIDILHPLKEKRSVYMLIFALYSSSYRSIVN